MVCLVPSNYALLLILNFIYVTILCPPYFLVTEFVKSTPTYCLLLPEIFYFIPELLSLYHMLLLPHTSSNFSQIHWATSFYFSSFSLSRDIQCRRWYHVNQISFITYNRILKTTNIRIITILFDTEDLSHHSCIYRQYFLTFIPILCLLPDAIW